MDFYFGSITDVSSYKERLKFTKLPVYKSLQQITDAGKKLEAAISVRLRLPFSEKYLEELLAYPNIRHLELNAAAGFGVIPSKILTSPIRSLEIVAAKEPIPAVLLQIPSLECLRISNSNYGQIEDEPIAAPVPLKRLDIVNSDVPEWLAQFQDLEILELNEISDYKKIPEAVLKLPRLRQLWLADSPFLSQLSPLAAHAGLEELILSGTYYSYFGKILHRIDKDINTLQNIKKLHLYGKFEGGIPEEVFQIKQLEYLEMSANSAQTLSSGVGNLSNLKELKLDYNYLKELPESIGKLSKLTNFSAAANQITRLPVAILSLPNLTTANLNGNPLLQTEGINIKKFLNWLLQIPDTERPQAAQVWQKETIPAEQLNAGLLYNALISNIFPLSGNALHYLTEIYPQAKKPLQAGATLFFSSTPANDKAILKSRLEKLGIKTASKLSPAVSHVLLGEKSKLDFKVLSEGNYCWISEAQLIDYLNKETPTFLIEESQKDKDSESITHIKKLLLNTDDSNVDLAFQLLKSGVPNDLCNELLFLSKFSTNKSHQAQAKKLLSAINNDALKPVIKIPLKTDAPIDWLLKLAEFTDSGIDAAQIAIYYQMLRPNRQHYDALNFVQLKGSSEQVRQFLQLWVKNGTIEWKRVGHNWAKAYKLPLPITELSQLSGIQKMNICCYPQYNEIQFTFKQFFSEQLAKLQALTELDLILGFIALDFLPEVLLKLPKLQYFAMKMEKHIAEALQQKMPNCKIYNRDY